MRSPRPIGGVVLLLVAAALLVAPGWASAQEDPSPDPDRGRVVVVSVPHLTWERFRSSPTPALGRLFERSALASLSVRTAAVETGPSPAYLTMGSGNRAVGDDSTDRDGVVLGRDEVWNGETGEQVFRRLAGIESDAPLLAVNVPRLRSANDAERYGTKVGALGDALADAGRRVAVVGNAGQSVHDVTRRHAALFGVDAHGALGAGTVGPELLEVDAGAPFGVRTQLDVAVDAVRRELGRSDVLLVELSDLARAEAERPNTSVERGDELYQEALRREDALVDAVLSEVDLGRDTVMVVAPDPPAGDEQLTVFAVAGPRVEPGWASSGTTRRARYVALTDVAPTVLERLGVGIPTGMEPTAVTSVADPLAFDEKVDVLVDASARAELRDRTFGPFAVVFVGLVVIDLALAILCLSRYPRLTRWVARLSMWILAVPPVAFLAGALPLQHLTPVQLGTAVYGAAALGAAAAALATRARPRVGPLVIMAALWLVLVVDVCTGARLQIDTLFGYSPVVAGRFAGFGNQAFSLLGIAAIAVVCGAYDLVGPSRSGRPPGWFLGAASAVFAISVVVDGAPGLGSDVGGVLALTPAAVLCVLLLARVRIRVRAIALSLAAALAVLGVFTLIDLARPADDRTHLGRFASKAVSSGVGQVIERKIATNLDVFSTIWAWIIPAALVYFAYITWRPNRTIVLVNANHWGYRAFGIAGLSLGVGAMLFNDSGVSMPAVMLAVALPWSTHIAVELDARRRRGVRLRSAGAPGVALVGAEGDPGSVDGEDGGGGGTDEAGGSAVAPLARFPRRRAR